LVLLVAVLLRCIVCRPAAPPTAHDDSYKRSLPATNSLSDFSPDTVVVGTTLSAAEVANELKLSPALKRPPSFEDHVDELRTQMPGKSTAALRQLLAECDGDINRCIARHHAASFAKRSSHEML
jgi:hypothetical protein